MNSSDSDKYDIILIVEYFRTTPYYLSLIKYLSADYRIGLYVLPIDPELLAKNQAVQTQFIDLCTSFGGELIAKEQPESDLLLIPQRPYTDEMVQLVSKIRAKNKVGVLALAWAGYKKYDSFFDTFELDTAFVIDTGLLNHLLSKRGDKSIYQRRELIEVGTPFMRYRVFNDVSIDYLIAMPTGFSFAHESDKWLFMETVLSLLDKIDPDDVVTLKTHNGMDRDQFSRPRHRWLASVLGIIPGFDRVLRKLVRRTKPNTLGIFVERIYTSFLYEKVLKRTVPFFSLTEFSQLAMEIFLPGVKKGIIGGLSNTTWGALYAKIPYYNCVDISVQRRNAEDLLWGEKNPSNTIEINLGYFGVPYCQGQLVFAKENFSILADSMREADMISEIRRLLKKTS
jgi:hypothetical protein